MIRFLDFLFPPRADERVIRDVTVDNFLSLLEPTLVDYTRPETIALLPFRNPQVRAALHEAKYHASEKAFTLLAATLSEYVRDADERSKKAVAIPIPLGKGRHQARGYNQVHEVLKRADTVLAIDPGLLTRARETVSQVSLPREKRQENMRGAFRAAHILDPSYLYIVVDDVTTTGATLQAAIDALSQAGATHILPLALAH